jgi:DNA-binding XRE family transcriptional regulator
MSQAELADKVGVSRIHMGRIENGSRNPTEWILKNTARALRIRMSDLGYKFVPRALPEKRDGTNAQTDQGWPS